MQKLVNDKVDISIQQVGKIDFKINCDAITNFAYWRKQRWTFTSQPVINQVPDRLVT